MKHTLSFPKSAFEVPKIRLEIGGKIHDHILVGIVISGLPPDGGSERFYFHLKDE